MHEILRFLLLYMSNSCELSKIKVNTIGRKTETELANEQMSLNKYYEALKPYGQCHHQTTNPWVLISMSPTHTKHLFQTAYLK